MPVELPTEEAIIKTHLLFSDTLLVLLHSDPLPHKELVEHKGSSYGINARAARRQH